MLELRVLGTVDLKNAAGEDLDALLTQPKRLALLVYLSVATPRGFHRRDRLLTLFWPELDQEHARASLRKSVYVIRRALGDDVLVSRGDEEIGVGPGTLWCDAVAFDEAIAEGRLAFALELYRGELLQGFFVPDALDFEQWLDAERQRVRDDAAAAAWALAERFETDQELTHAQRWARKVVQFAPDDERKLRKVITMLDRLGDRAGAVRVYEWFARRLEQELGIQPSKETRELIAAVRGR